MYPWMIGADSTSTCNSNSATALVRGGDERDGARITWEHAPLRRSGRPGSRTPSKSGSGTFLDSPGRIVAGSEKWPVPIDSADTGNQRAYTIEFNVHRGQPF